MPVLLSINGKTNELKISDLKWDLGNKDTIWDSLISAQWGQTIS